MRCDYLPRYKDIEYPDVGDIHNFGLKSCVGSIKKYNKNIRGIHKNKTSKAITRRYWKRRSKYLAKLLIRKELDDL